MGAARSTDSADAASSDTNSVPTQAPQTGGGSEDDDYVSAHLYRFRRKLVRDLAWALTSPHVLGDPRLGGVGETDDVNEKTSSSDTSHESPEPSQEMGDTHDKEMGDTNATTTSSSKSNTSKAAHPRVFRDTDAVALLKRSTPWLTTLDHDDTHVLRWIKSQRGSTKLGFYFGALVEYAVRFNPAIGAEGTFCISQVMTLFSGPL